MKSNHPETATHVYRPMLKQRARFWFSSITIFALVGYFAAQSAGQPVGSTEGLFILLYVLLAIFGVFSLTAGETIRLETSPAGLVYRNAFGKIAAAPVQVTGVGAVKQQVVLQLDQNRFVSAVPVLGILKAPYSDGTYIPLYLFLDPWESAAQLANFPLGRDLITLLPHLFEDLPVEIEAPPDNVPALQTQTAETTSEPRAILLLGGRYRLRSRASITLLVGLVLVAPVIMALAGLFDGAQMVLLPGLLAGWLLPMLLGGIEVRPTPLTDLIALGVMLFLGGASTLLLLAGCTGLPGAVGCAASEQRANLFAFFFFPLIMYLLPWLIFTRLPLLFRRK